jgi:hypothetical protein
MILTGENFCISLYKPLAGRAGTYLPYWGPVCALLFCSVSASEMMCDVKARVSIERDSMEVTLRLCFTACLHSVLPVFSFCSQVRNW